VSKFATKPVKMESQSSFVVKEAPINYIFTPPAEIKVEWQLSCSINFCAFLCAERFCDVNSKRLIKVVAAAGSFESPCSCRRMQPAAPSSRDCCLTGRERLPMIDDQ